MWRWNRYAERAASGKEHKPARVPMESLRRLADPSTMTPLPSRLRSTYPSNSSSRLSKNNNSKVGGVSSMANALASPGGLGGGGGSVVGGDADDLGGDHQRRGKPSSLLAFANSADMERFNHHRSTPPSSLSSSSSSGSDTGFGGNYGPKGGGRSAHMARMNSLRHQGY